MTSKPRAWLWCLTVGLFVLPAAVTEAPAEWNLWQSPNDNTEVPDQQQTTTNTEFWSLGTSSSDTIGQQFVPTVASLYRIDIRIQDRWDVRRATFKLWFWNTNRAVTVSAAPLYTETIPLGGGIYPRLFSLYPQLTVYPWNMYYFEIIANGRDLVPVTANAGPVDVYPAGKAWSNGWFPDDDPNNNDHYDVWFKTYGSPQGSPTFPSLTPSNASAPWYAPDPPCSVLTPGCPGYGGSCPASGDSHNLFNVYSKCDYYKRFKDFIDYGKCAYKSCGSNYGQEALLSATLYEDSCRRGACNETYALDAIAMMVERYDYQFCNDENPNCQTGCACNALSHTDWFEWYGVAYQYIKNSPSLSANNRNRIKCVMIDSGQKFWKFREKGAGNRPLQAATMYLLATNAWDPFDLGMVPQCSGVEFPQSEHDKWVTYAEDNWNIFWNSRNWGSDSSNYNDNVATKLALEYAYWSGRDALVWSDPGFRKLVEDLYQRMSPLGLDGNFGENAGVGELQSALLWFFEKAARMYGEPKYKWMAHQIYRFNESRTCDNPPSQESFTNGISDVALAYLDADDTLSDATPAAQAELLAANQQVASVNYNNFKVAQTFKPTASPLVRLDVNLKGNNNNTSPATIKLWRFGKSYASTVAGTPLFQGTVPTSSVPAILSFYPFLEVDTTATYLVEVSRSAPKIVMGGSPQLDGDQYPDGLLYLEGIPTPGADMRFSTYSLTPNGSTFTTRLQVSRRPVSQWDVPCPAAGDTCPEMHVYGTATIPDKLILRSGWQPNDLHALFTLSVNGYDHSDWNPGALSLLTDDNAILMAETPFPYWNVLPRSTIDNTMSEVRRYSGGTYSVPPESVTVSKFSDTRKATVAYVDWTDVRGWGVQQQRRLFFVKDRFLWIRDRFTFPSAMSVAVGTVWHAGDVSPNPGTNWYNLYYRQPLGNVYEQKNPERYASLYFIKRGTEDTAAFREATYDPPAGCSTVLTDSCQTIVYDPNLDCRSAPPFARVAPA